MINEETIIKFKSGDTEAFEALYKAFWNKVYGFSKLYVEKQEDREDIVQEVFFQLWKKRNIIDHTKELDGLLFILTKNMILNKLRRRQLQSLDELGIDIPDDRIHGIVESRIDEPYFQQYIDKLIAALPPKQREAFLLRRSQHLSIKDISSIMGISESGVKRNINLALKFIKANLPLFIIFTQI